MKSEFETARSESELNWKRTRNIVTMALALLAVVLIAGKSIENESRSLNSTVFAEVSTSQDAAPSVTTVQEPLSTYAHMKNFIAANGCPDIAFVDTVHHQPSGFNLIMPSMGCEVTPSAIKIRVKIGYAGFYGAFRKLVDYTMSSSNSLSCKAYKQPSVAGSITFWHDGVRYRCNGYEQYLRLVAKGPTPTKALPSSGIQTALMDLVKQNACPTQIILKSSANAEFALVQSLETCQQYGNTVFQHISQQAFNGNVVMLKYSTNTAHSEMNEVCLVVYNPSGAITYAEKCHRAGTTIDLSSSEIALTPAPFSFTVKLENIEFVY